MPLFELLNTAASLREGVGVDAGGGGIHTGRRRRGGVAGGVRQHQRNAFRNNLHTFEPHRWLYANLSSDIPGQHTRNNQRSNLSSRYTHF